MEIQSTQDLIDMLVRLETVESLQPALGSIVEWVACRAFSGDSSVNGPGRDFASSHIASSLVPKIHDPRGVMPVEGGLPVRAPYDQMPQTARQQADAELWLADPRIWVEVKHHRLRPEHLLDDPSAAYFHDTRSSGPKRPFAPPADAYLKVFLNPDGALLTAWLVPHEELMEYVRTETRRGGAWNYKVAFSRLHPLGHDVTSQLVAALMEPLFT